MNANDEAMRLWTEVRRREWPAELAMLPEIAEINGMQWPYREAVRQRLLQAVKAMQVGVGYLGMNAENRHRSAGNAED